MKRNDGKLFVLILVFLIIIILTGCKQDYYTLSTTTEGKGDVMKNPNKDYYEKNSIVELTAKPEEGWEFDHWEGSGGFANYPLKKISFAIDGDYNLKAVFKKKSILDITKKGKGNIRKIPDQNSYNEHTEVKVVATPEKGWSFDHWEAKGVGFIDTTNNVINVKTYGNIYLKAIFVKNYDLNIIIEGHGIVMKNPKQTSFKKGSTVDLKVNPDIGWVFDHWEGNNISDEKAQTITINMNNDINIKAIFKKKTTYRDKIPKDREPFWFRLENISPKYSNMWGQFGASFSFYIDKKLKQDILNKFYVTATAIKKYSNEVKYKLEELEIEESFLNNYYKTTLRFRVNERSNIKKWIIKFKNPNLKRTQQIIINIPRDIEQYYGWEEEIIASYELEDVLKDIYKNIFDKKYRIANKQIKQIENILELKDPRVLFLYGFLELSETGNIYNAFGYWETLIKTYNIYGKAGNILDKDYLMNFYLAKIGKHIMKMTIGERTSVTGIYGADKRRRNHFRQLNVENKRVILDYNGDLVNVENAYKNKLTLGAKAHFKENIAQFVRYVFLILPDIEEVQVNIYVPSYHDEYGTVKDKLIGYVKMDKNIYDKINWSDIRNEMIADLFEENWF